MACSGSAGGLKLDPVSSVHEPKIDGVTPTKDGNLFIVVDVRLNNGTGEALSLGAPHFSIQTTGGVEITGDPVTEGVKNGCTASASVAAMAETECTVVFSAPADADTKLLIYTNQAGERTEAPLTTKPCGLCHGACKDFASDPENCGACDVSAGAGTCQNGVPTCGGSAMMCGADCVDVSTSAENCGACGAAVPPLATCVGGKPVCASGSLLCGATCKNVSTDSANCGACNKSCPAPTATDFSCYPAGEGPFAGTAMYGCNDAACTTAYTSSSRVSCDSICGAHGLKCKAADWAFGGGGQCTENACSATPPTTGGPDNFDFFGINCLCQG